VKIRLDQVHEATHKVRAAQDEAGMGWLKQSMAEVGQVCPIKVRTVEGGYELVYGHRRTKAARELGWSHIEGSVQELDDEAATVQAIIENILHKNLDEVSEGLAYTELVENFGMTHRQIAVAVGKARAWVSRLIELVADPVCEVFTAGDLITSGDSPPRSLIRDAGIKAQVLRSAFPDDVETRKVLAHRVVDAQLSRPQVKDIAKTAAYIKEDDVREEVIRQYDGHEPAADVHKRVNLHDWRAAPVDNTTQERWDSPPEVADLLKPLRALLANLRRVKDVGKLSPEGGRHVAAMLRKCADDLTKEVE